MNTHPINSEETAKDLPCSILKLALDDDLTILTANEEFYNLIDYNRSETLPKTVFKIVYSTDIIYFTHQVADQKRRKDNRLILFFRVLQKNGSLKWIMISGSKTEENFQLQGKILPVYFCTAADVTSHMTEYKQMEQEIECHRTILELSRELFFEYLIAADTLYFSELFREIFDKEATIKNFSRKLEKTKIIHPDDLPVVISTYKNMMGGKKQAGLEIRLITREGKIAWYLCYASIIYDENKNPCKVVGKMALISKYKDEQETSVSNSKLQIDALTKVYSKDTADRLISQSMSAQNHNSLSALFLCEVQNYKGANELARVLDNENVLAKVASVFKSLLRGTDIIGRTALGEFVIYMKDIGSERSAYDLAEQICREVNNLYSYEFNKNRVFISIGIAFVLGRADYTSALTNAKTALVMAKKNFSSSFEIFYPPAINNA